MAVLPVVAGYFLLLYAGVGLIRDKRFFGSAPKENPDAIPDRKPERFPGAHILGWTLGVLALALMVGGFVLGRHPFRVRLLGVFRPVRGHALPGGAVRYCLFRLDPPVQFQLFRPFYPELKGIGGPHQFGYNKKVHALHFVFYLPVSPLLAWVCTLR